MTDVYLRYRKSGVPNVKSAGRRDQFNWEEDGKGAGGETGSETH